MANESAKPHCGKRSVSPSANGHFLLRNLLRIFHAELRAMSERCLFLFFPHSPPPSPICSAERKGTDPKEEEDATFSFSPEEEETSPSPSFIVGSPPSDLAAASDVVDVVSSTSFFCPESPSLPDDSELLREILLPPPIFAPPHAPELLYFSE